MKRSFNDLKLLLAFVIVFSMLSLPGSLSAGSYLPQIHLAAANTAPNEPWYPAGPSMDTVVNSVFADQNAEFTALQQGIIDLTDSPLPPALISSLSGDARFFVTST